jgi:hypothetical protein
MAQTPPVMAAAKSGININRTIGCILYKEYGLGLGSDAGTLVTSDQSVTTLARLCPKIEEKSAITPPW